MPRPQLSLRTLFAATAAVAVLCWAATINPLFGLPLVYAVIGAVYVVIGASLTGGERESKDIK